MKFSEFLKTTREEKRLTQEKLGFELSYDPKVIRCWETEKRFPKIDDVEAIADKLGYEIKYVKKEQNSIIDSLKPKCSNEMPKDIVCNCTKEQK